MEYQKFNHQYVIRMDKGEEIIQSLETLCRAEHIRLAAVSGIGAVNLVIAGLFQTKEKRFLGHTWQGDMEIVSLSGVVTEMEGEPYLHLHIAVADEEGRVRGGHLKKAVISATGEIVLNVAEGNVDRSYSPQIGLNLLQFTNGKRIQKERKK